MLGAGFEHLNTAAPKLVSPWVISGPSHDVERFQAPKPDRPREPALFDLESDDFVECYRLHYPRLVRALELAGASGPVAEDVAQEAFARMLAHWRRVRSGSSPAGYAYRTGFRLLARQASRQWDLEAGSGQAAGPKPLQPASIEDSTGNPVGSGSGSGELGGRPPGPPAGAWARSSVAGAEGLVTTRLAVAAGLAAMPPRRRVCAVLSLVVGLPTAEVAAALGITEATVRKHIEEARADLRLAL